MQCGLKLGSLPGPKHYGKKPCAVDVADVHLDVLLLMSSRLIVFYVKPANDILYEPRSCRGLEIESALKTKWP